MLLQSIPSIVQFISEEPAAATPVSRAPKARALTEQDIASKKYSIFDVVLPLPGYSIIYPEGALGDRYKEIMKEDGLDWTNLFRKQKYVCSVIPSPLSIFCITSFKR